MSAKVSGKGRGAATSRSPEIRARVGAYDWPDVERRLNERGHARLPALLDRAECRALRELYGDRERFRSFVDLGSHRYGDHGDYRYFARPLPGLVDQLRTHLYSRLAPIANRWQEALGREERFPRSLRGFLETCRAHGQERPTPLVLRYEAGGYNCLHQDLYGDVAFPLQVAVLLSDPAREFESGPFLLTEQRPRMQSRGESIALAQGEALVFPNRERPVLGKRGHYRAVVRHGVAVIERGERYTLGIIFHDAR